MTLPQLRVRTEFTFGRAFGKLDKVMARLKDIGAPAAAITDDTTWGHVSFYKAAKAAGITPILGAEVMLVNDARVKSQERGGRITLLAKNVAGLSELYETLTRAYSNECFYYVPRLDWRDVEGLTSNVVSILSNGSGLARSPGSFLAYVPGDYAWNRRVASSDRPAVVLGDNWYPSAADRTAYEVASFRHVVSRTTAAHILDEYELDGALAGVSPVAIAEAITATRELAEGIKTELPRAKMVSVDWPTDLRTLCRRGASARGIRLDDPAYGARLDYELSLIETKGFTDYFHVITDLVAYAKTVMLVGPARGSSAGSLVCYLLGITDVDPLVHRLLFERFIDITREDLPDIDIDFQDTRRDLVVEYLRRKYGAQRVGQIGTVLRYKVDSSLAIVGTQLGIPRGEMADLKGAIVKRSSGDARAQFAIYDAFTELEVGRALIAKYPALSVAADLEGGAQYSGKHAAGLLVVDSKISEFATIGNNGTAQIDKKDAETLNMLKIDALGLRTLSVLSDCLEMIGKERDWLVTYPLDDTEAFAVFNRERFAGIFQYEGYALQSLCRQMKVDRFDDVAVITALARPGPLHCGAAADFIACRTGARPPQPMHPLIEHITSETYGVVIYQEQVIEISRTMGQLSWQHTAELRKAMSKTMGDEFFNRYWGYFEDGAKRQGISSADARRVWDKICTFGSWAFNKSHAISYGLLSYWCAMLKARYPLEFAAATLRHAKNDEQARLVLRELVKDGHKFTPVDPDHSDITWTVRDGALLGGLTNIVGIGPEKAKKVLSDRASGKKPTPAMRQKLLNAQTPYDHIFETHERYGDMYANPRRYFVTSGPISELQSVVEPGEYVFIAKLREKKLRDMNEVQSVAKRGGRKILSHSVFLNLVLEDDSGTIIAQISRYDYPKLGLPIQEQGRIGDYYLWKGTISNDGWRIVRVSTWRKLPATAAELPTNDCDEVVNSSVESVATP